MSISFVESLHSVGERRGAWDRGCGKSVGKGLVFKGEVIQASKKPFRLSPCTAVAVK
jgi:hypothetical protein